jgi:hypothetical protein
MNIVSQICTDRHPEIFDLKENYKLIFSASKSKIITDKHFFLKFIHFS